jgi:dephospho-CoA kinase
MMGRIVAVSGLCGVGKSTAVSYLARVAGGEVVYFGATVLRVLTSGAFRKRVPANRLCASNCVTSMERLISPCWKPSG